jgi:hypothetical protein
MRQVNRRAALLDSELLVLFVVGSYDPSRIDRFKRTNKYDIRAFELLSAILARFDSFWVTPHVLTEASNWLGYLDDPIRADCRNGLASLVRVWHEQYTPAAVLVNGDVYERLGLTDESLFALRHRGTLVTDDLDLYLAALGVGAECINFTHERGEDWANRPRAVRRLRSGHPPPA